jgi:hypothetical protein
MLTGPMRLNADYSPDSQILGSRYETLRLLNV